MSLNYEESVDLRFDRNGHDLLTSRDLGAQPPTQVVPAAKGVSAPVGSVPAAQGGTTISSLVQRAGPQPADPVIGTDAKVDKAAKKQLKAERRQEKRVLHKQAKAQLSATKQELAAKKAALETLKLQQKDLQDDIKEIQPKKRGTLSQALVSARDFAHKQWGMGQPAKPRAPGSAPTPAQVLGTLNFVNERRKLEGEIEILRQHSAKLKAQTSGKAARRQGIGYWQKKAFQGMSRREGMSRAGQIEHQSIPSPIVSIRLVEDTVNALLNVKRVISHTTARSYVRSIEKMAVGRLQEIHTTLKAAVLERKAEQLSQNPAAVIAKLSQHEEIRARLVKGDPELSRALTERDSEALLADRLVANILSEDAEELLAIKEEGKFSELFQEKQKLLDGLRPVLEMKAQIDLKRELRLLGSNVYKVGVTSVDAAQMVIGVLQLFSAAEPTGIASLIIGTLKIALIVPSFPFDTAIIRSNLKDASASLSNLREFDRSFQEMEQLTPQQAINHRIFELVKGKDFERKADLELKKEEVKALDQAFKLMKQGKMRELNALIASGKLSKESEYVLKPELRVIDQWIQHNANKPEYKDAHGALVSLRDLAVDSDLETAKECVQLAFPGSNLGLLFDELSLRMIPPNDVAIYQQKRKLAEQVAQLKVEVRDHEPTSEVFALQEASRALTNGNATALSEILTRKDDTGRFVLSLKSQQAVRPRLKAVDDRLQALTETDNVDLDDPQFIALQDARRQLLETGTVADETLERLSPENRTAAAKGVGEVKIVQGRAAEVLAESKKLFLDDVGPYMKQRLKMKRITEWVQVASDLLAACATAASVAALILLITTGWGGLGAFALVFLFLAGSTVVRYGGSFLVDQILKGQQRRRQFLQAEANGQVQTPTNWKGKIDQGLRRAGLRGHLMDKREFYPAIYKQMEEELKNWDAIKASGQEEKTIAFIMFNTVRDYLPEKLPLHVDAKRYAQMLVSNEGHSQKTFAQAMGTGMLHHDLSRFTPHKILKLARKDLYA